MSDLAVTLNEENAFDLVIESDDLKTEHGLRSAVAVSLFTDARVTEEELPLGESDPRGWWGDTFLEESIGSKLWLLAREKMTPDVLARAELFCREALAWMIEDGVARQVDVTVEVSGPEMVGILVEVYRPTSETSETFRYFLDWQGELSR